MNGIESLKQKLSNREKVAGTIVCQIGYTGLPEMFKNAGLDFVMVDMEHGAFYPENIGDFGYACRCKDIPLIARVQDCEYHCISKPIDMGADGVLIPRTETMEQVETAIRSLRMYPYGKKGVGGRLLLRPGETVDDFNKNRLLFIQIESVQGVNILDEVLTLHGDQIAGILIGPADFGVSMGIGLTRNDELMGHIRRTVSICEAHGKSCGIFMLPHEIEGWHKEGMNIFWADAELEMLARGAKNIRDIVDSL